MAHPTKAKLIKPWKNHPAGTVLENLSGRVYRDLMLMGVIKDTRKKVKVKGSPADKAVKGSPVTK